MKKELPPNTHFAGDVVHAKANPSLTLMVRRYVDRVYYCTICDQPDSKELVYYDRELIDAPSLTERNKEAGN